MATAAHATYPPGRRVFARYGQQWFPATIADAGLSGNLPAKVCIEVHMARVPKPRSCPVFFLPGHEFCLLDDSATDVRPFDWASQLCEQADTEVQAALTAVRAADAADAAAASEAGRNVAPIDVDASSDDDDDDDVLRLLGVTAESRAPRVATTAKDGAEPSTTARPKPTRPIPTARRARSPAAPVEPVARRLDFADDDADTAPPPVKRHVTEAGDGSAKAKPSRRVARRRKRRTRKRQRPRGLSW